MGPPLYPCSSLTANIPSLMTHTIFVFLSFSWLILLSYFLLLLTIHLFQCNQYSHSIFPNKSRSQVCKVCRERNKTYISSFPPLMDKIKLITTVKAIPMFKEKYSCTCSPFDFLEEENLNI